MVQVNRSEEGMFYNGAGTNEQIETNNKSVQRRMNVPTKSGIRRQERLEKAIA